MDIEPNLRPHPICSNNSAGGLTEPTEEFYENSVHSVDSVHSVNSVTGRVQQAIAKTRLTSTGESHLRNKVWNFARELKAIPELAILEAHDLTEHVQAWHDELPRSNSDWFFEDTEELFWKAWEKVKYAAGDGPVEHAFAIAVVSEPPPCALQFQGGNIKLLATLCRELQRLSGDGPFYLSCRTAGKLLEVSHVIAARWLGILVRKKVIQVVTPGGPATNKATRYQYLPLMD